MASLTLIFNRKQPAKIGTLSLDATLRETHERTNDVPIFPIENGATISDHVRSLPITVLIDGFVTNSPVSLLGAGGIFLNNSFGNNRTRVESAFDFLEEQYAGSLDLDGNTIREPIIIVTGLRTYNNMIMTRLSVPRDRSTGDALNFSATFQQLDIVDTLLVASSTIKEVNRLQAAESSNVGRQNAPEATPPVTTATSIIKGLWDTAVRIGETP